MFNAKARQIGRLEKSQNKLIKTASEKEKRYEGERPGKLHKLLLQEQEKLSQMKTTLETLKVPENKGLMRKGEVPKGLSTSVKDDLREIAAVSSAGTGGMAGATSMATGQGPVGVAVSTGSGALVGAATPYAVQGAVNLKRRFTEVGKTNARIRKVIKADGKGMTKEQVKQMTQKLAEVIAAKEKLVRMMQADLDSNRRKRY